jgi:tetratricopeptide (TPR) repeat protein
MSDGCLKNLNRLDEALVSNDMAIKYNPSLSKVYLHRGYCLENLGRPDLANKSYHMAQFYNPHNSFAYNCPCRDN